MEQIGTTHILTESRASANSTFAIGGVSRSADSYVVAESLVLRINICDEKPAHRKCAIRYRLFYDVQTFNDSATNRQKNNLK